MKHDRQKNMAVELAYIMLFVADMDQTILFYRDVLGFNLLFQSPEWTEFATGETRLALHPATAENPAGKIQIGFHVEDLAEFFRVQSAKGLKFTQGPKRVGRRLVARFMGPDGLECSISAEDTGG
jgi:catechol 2,3-dioxygenase-like lactoylglutathione lyase family enzyme